MRRLKLDPFSGAAFIFRPKRADRVKILIWDGSGLILIYKRLEEANSAGPASGRGDASVAGPALRPFRGAGWAKVRAVRKPAEAVQ